MHDETQLDDTYIVQYGLYSALTPGLVYAFLGTCPPLTIGPVALLAAMTAPHAENDPAYAVLLAFITGLVVTLCGLLKLGKEVFVIY